MKVKALKTYYDLVLKKEIKEGQEVEMTEERAAELSTEKNKTGLKLVEIMETAEQETPEEAPEEAQEETVAEETPEEAVETVSDSDTEEEKKPQTKRRGKKAEKVEEEEGK